jgi:ankyrin repeat protein
MAEKQAARSANQKFVTRMSLSDAFDNADVRALAEAASKGKVEQVTQLIDQGVNINHQGTLHVTPLYWGLRNHKGFCALLEHGADPNVVFGDGSSVLLWATIKKDKRFLRTVLHYGGDPDLGEGAGAAFNTPMEAAVMKNDLEAVDILLTAGANINVTNRLGGTPVESAIYIGRYKLAKELLKRADNLTDTQKESLLSSMKRCKKNMIPGCRKERELCELIEWVEKKGGKGGRGAGEQSRNLVVLKDCGGEKK